MLVNFENKMSHTTKVDARHDQLRGPRSWGGYGFVPILPLCK